VGSPQVDQPDAGPGLSAARGSRGHALVRPGTRETPRLLLVCLLLLALIALLILLPQTSWARALLTFVTGGGLVTALSMARMPRRFVWTVTLIVVTAVTTSIVGILLAGAQATTATMVVLTVLVFAVPLGVIAGLRDQRTVNIQTVFGAISVYLVIGVFFALLMTVVAGVTAGPYFAQGTDGTLSERVYFSYVTLATLGYGDFTPATGLGRLISVLESVIGNLYLVTAVALVVSRVGRPRPLPASRSTGDPADPPA
jgi:hypothetical protein